MKKFDKCPCGSGASCAQCCAPLLSGERNAETAEQLMRSRYSAYVTGNVDYLVETTHPDERAPDLHKSIKKWMKQVEWFKLLILSKEAGQAADSEGRVEFIAEYMTNASMGKHHECSLFKKEDGRWYYVDAEFED